MTRSPALPLPNWPAMLTTELAARYLMIGEATFRAMAARERVKPVDLGLSVVRWRKSDLDGLVDKLPAKGSDVAPTPDSADPAKAALERVARRTGGKP